MLKRLAPVTQGYNLSELKIKAASGWGDRNEERKKGTLHNEDGHYTRTPQARRDIRLLAVRTCETVGPISHRY